MLSKTVIPLPPNGERLAGETADTKDNYSLLVSNADGYLCHLQATCHFPVAPATVYAIFVNTGDWCCQVVLDTQTLVVMHTLLTCR